MCCLVQYSATSIWILYVLVGEEDYTNNGANAPEYTTSVVDAVLCPENIPDTSARKFDYPP